jgi:glycosyltransferase involved in cell wall biosynthesis
MVVEPLARLHAAGCSTRLAVLAPAGQLLRSATRRQWKDIRASVRKRYSGHFAIVAIAPSRLSAYPFNKWIARMWFAMQGKPTSPLIIHCRGHEATLIALAMGRSTADRVLFDMRGLAWAEQALLRRPVDPERVPEDLTRSERRTYDDEKQAAQCADAVICLSRPLMDWIIRHFDIPSSKIHVIPTTSEPLPIEQAAGRRRAIRSRLGIEHQYVVSYCGSLREWQRWEHGVRLFSEIKKVVPDAYLMVVTRDVRKCEDVLRMLNVDKTTYQVVSADYDSVSDYLEAADLGLITRGLGASARLADRVSAPVKFSEYLAAGTPVTIAERIGDFSEMVEKSKLGVVCPDGPVEAAAAKVIEFIDEYKRDEQAVRRRCHEAALSSLSRDYQAQRILSVYSEMLVTRGDTDSRRSVASFA